MCILPHVKSHHLGYLVDNKTVSTVIIGIGSCKHRVETGFHRCMSSHQSRQAFGIMKDTPRPVPGTALRERASPFRRVKSVSPFPIGIFCPHESIVGIVKVAVVEGFPVIGIGNLFPANGVGKTCDTPVGVSIFKGLGRSLVHFGIGNIA